MTFNDVLLGLLVHLRAENKPIIISWNTIQNWPDGTLELLLKVGLLIRTSAAQSIECHACENRCFMDIITLIHDDPALSRAFIVCDDVEMQSQMGRVQIPLVQLQQWQADVKRLSKVIAGLLGLKDKITFTVNQPVIKLGMLKTARGRRWVTLNSLDLSLEVNQHTVPVEEVLYFEGEQLFIDQDAIDDLLNREPLRQGKSYIPLTNKREARKLETQMMYQDWQDAYVQLKKQNITKSNKWCSLQIAKMDIANAKDAETIRKNMVK
ncbi:conserved hypothetical protein [Bathymodiolus platifrons methanotrophic gill symbiont]|uniref:hypothetical protein n=1 Tax=Bathymodiolus platifrons methanotrophic gill symbiont TaxID=113268 RepID=UPI000B417ADF|nr:hypothetical protein [Bathymodiolus platifrons methanotrophic gill symbiont]GAW86555.1 conserved hypothetical protein [Bathymodiolus platifrons methanotrophic gill symbiont]